MITEIKKHCLTTSFKMEDMRQIEIFICTFSIHIYVIFQFSFILKKFLMVH